ncbi:MMPL family transporter [Streptomyces sp. NBC_00455]|uniref:MMPL family transporter n=1 Tax=Streptomyces sp. NBC_00455 TaxID=2903654 RepID=UPI002E203B7D
MDTLKQELPSAAGTSAQIVFVAPEGHQITEPQYAKAVGATMAEADKAPQVVGVTDPVQSKVISPDHSTGLGQVHYQVTRAELHDDSLTSLEKTTQPAKDAGLTVEVGGSAYGSSHSTGHTKELMGVAVALVVLTVTFGSLFAAGMPLLTAIAGVAITLLGLSALTGVLTISSTAPSLASMLGLAVGIDYALFILSRHRSQLATGMDTEESTARATATAGSAVVFAGLTVIIALCGLAVVHIPFLTVMGLGGAAAVLIAVGVSTTLLPALMGFAGERLRPGPGSRAAHESGPPTRAGTADAEPWANAGAGSPSAAPCSPCWPSSSACSPSRSRPGTSNWPCPTTAPPPQAAASGRRTTPSPTSSGPDSTDRCSSTPTPPTPRTRRRPPPRSSRT